LTGPNPLKTALVAALLLTGGCTQARSVDVFTLMSHGNCQGLQRGVRAIELEDVARLRGSHMIGFESDATTPPADDVLLVAISLGQRPTAGYRLTVDGPADFADGVLTVRVNETRPPADAMVAQVLTHPCVVIGVPDPRAQHIRVIDNTGQLVGELTR
jgi:hypothetical protein